MYGFILLAFCLVVLCFVLAPWLEGRNRVEEEDYEPLVDDFYDENDLCYPCECENHASCMGGCSCEDATHNVQAL